MTVVCRLDLSKSTDEELDLVNDAASSASVFVYDTHDQRRLDASIHSSKILVLDVYLSPVNASLPEMFSVMSKY